MRCCLGSELICEILSVLLDPTPFLHIESSHPHNFICVFCRIKHFTPQNPRNTRPAHANQRLPRRLFPPRTNRRRFHNHPRNVPPTPIPSKRHCRIRSRQSNVSYPIGMLFSPSLYHFRPHHYFDSMDGNGGRSITSDFERNAGGDSGSG